MWKRKRYSFGPKDLNLNQLGSSVSHVDVCKKFNLVKFTLSTIMSSEDKISRIEEKHSESEKDYNTRKD
jgi:hypothetical protein